MLLDFLQKYLQDVEAAVRKLEGAYIERYEEEIIAANRVNLRIRVRFPHGHMLELNESVIDQEDQIIHLNYRYHFQDEENSLVFRYDNTPHFPHLETYPHHKHLSNDVIPIEQPSIVEVIDGARLSN